MKTLATYCLLALASSLLLTPLCGALARRFGYVAAPKTDRWHSRPTALLGGVAIVAVTNGLSLTVRPLRDVAVLIVCGSLIAAFGLVDDILSLKASTKLIAQITVASIFVFFGFRLQWTESMVGDTMLTLFWIVGVTNAFNLLDNMDGLSAGTSVIAGAFLLVGLASSSGSAPTGTAIYLASLLGATLGFLVYNFHPASIFMGDTGSLFLGLSLASLTLMAQPQVRSRADVLSAIAVPVLPLLIPIFDTALVTTLRMWSGRSPSQGGRDHASHRLVALGLSERRAVVILWLLAAAGGTISVLWRRLDVGWGWIATAIFLLAMTIFGAFLALVRVYDDAELAPGKAQAVTPLVFNFMYKRRVAEVLLDLCLIPIAYYTAYRLRFEGPLLTANYQFFIQSLSVVLACQLLSLFALGGYRGTWRFFGMMDAVVFAKSVVVGTAASLIAVLFLYRFENYSRSVFLIYAAVLFLLLSGSRASFRLVSEFVLRHRTGGARCVICGSNGASVGIVREALGNDMPVKIIGFIDNDPARRRERVAGFPVIGGYGDLMSLVENDEVDCVILTEALMDAQELHRLERACSDREVELLRLHVNLKKLSAAS